MENALEIVDNNQMVIEPMTSKEQVDQASENAKLLQGIVKQAGLSQKFGGKKEHLSYEAWQTIGQFYNCTPVTEWTKPIEEGSKIIGWEARVNIVNANGRIIASAESMCMKDEPNWKNKPNYALRSMAQTRTAGKAFRSVFAWVAVLAGYSGTPAEEMSHDFATLPTDRTPETPVKTNPKNPDARTEGQSKKIWAMIKKMKDANIIAEGEDEEMFNRWIKEEYDTTEIEGKDGKMHKVITKTDAMKLIDEMEKDSQKLYNRFALKVFG